MSASRDLKSVATQLGSQDIANKVVVIDSCCLHVLQQLGRSVALLCNGAASLRKRGRAEIAMISNPYLVRTTTVHYISWRIVRALTMPKARVTCCQVEVGE